MMGRHSGRESWSRMVAVALVIVPILGLLAPATETEKVVAKGEAKAKFKKAQKAREVLASIESLSKAVNKDAASGTKPNLPARPVKVVTRPSMTPEGLDALIDKELAAARIPLAAQTTDVEFVRRVTLDLTGKLPTPEQVFNFVQTQARDKRPKLIDYLLRGEEFAANLSHYWRDVVKFRATNPNGQQVGYEEFEAWIAKQIEKNRPWDEITREMITAVGRNDENGAVALSLAHESQAAEMAGEVARIFLGVQIQCAQCHDHPTDSWKRKQFHEFASFFAGTKSKRIEKGTNVFAVDAVANVPRYTMPDKEDPQKQIPVEPRFFLAKDAPSISGLNVARRRELAASYVTGQDNPWFARAFVNRVWYTLMGEAFYGPVDDMGPDREAKSPGILEPLATEWSAGGYDIRWLYRTILNTRAYQREIRSTHTQAGRTPFASNCPSRLRSDQILDSLDQVLDLHRAPAGGGGGRGAAGKAANKKRALTKDLVAATGKAMKGAGKNERTVFSTLYGSDPSTPNDDVLGTIPQALYLMNSPQLNRAMTAAGGNTVLGRILSSTPDNRQALLALYIRAFSRGPTPKEQQACLRYIDATGDRREAFEDIFWSLINSTEFITRR